MDSDKLVKVVITSYNRRHWLESAVESVLAQSYRHLHIVIVDDASPDGAGRWAQEYAASNPRLVSAIVKETNRGVADTIRVGLSAGPPAPYVALLNDDDLWYPAKLELQIEQLKSDRAVSAVCCEAAIIDGQGRDTGQVFSSEYGRFGNGDLSDLIRGNHACASTLVTTADVASQVASSLPDETLVWDYYLLLVAAARGSVRWMDRPLAAFRESGTGQHDAHEDLMWRQTTIARQTWLKSDPLAGQGRGQGLSSRSLVASATADVASRQLSARKWREYMWHGKMVVLDGDPRAMLRLADQTCRAAHRATRRRLRKGRNDARR